VSEKRYTIALVEPQLWILSQALECLGRLQSGQIEYAVDAGAMDRVLNADSKRVRELCTELRAVLYPELERDESYGVSSGDRPMAGEAYTIKEALDRALDGRDRGSMQWGTWPRPEVRELAGTVDPAGDWWDPNPDFSGFRVSNRPRVTVEDLDGRRGPSTGTRFPDSGSNPNTRPVSVPDWATQITDPNNLRKEQDND